MNIRRTSILILAALLASGSQTARGDEIHESIKAGDIALLQAILQKSPADIVDERAVGGSTPLHWTALYNLPEAARLLVEKDAALNSRTDNGSTPLH